MGFSIFFTKEWNALQQNKLLCCQKTFENSKTKDTFTFLKFQTPKLYVALHRVQEILIKTRLKMLAMEL